MEVEGVWKNFDIKIIQESNIPEILDFLNNEFHYDEPIGGRLHPRDEEYVSLINIKIGDKLKSNPNYSIIAFDKQSGKVAGVQLVFIWEKKEADAMTLQTEMVNVSKYRQRIVQDAIYSSFNSSQFGLFDKYGVDEIAWNFIASTGSDYRGQGLATELQRRMNIQIKRKGLKVIFGIFSSPFSRRSASKCGFVEEIGTRSYYGVARDQNGLLVMPEAQGEEDYASLMVRVL